MSLQSEVTETINPNDDFYNYVNQKWRDANPIPASKARVSAFSILDDQNMERLKTLLEQPDNENDSETARLAKHFYRIAMDESAIEAAGIAPFLPILETILKLKTKDDLKAFIIDQRATGKNMAWRTSLNVDDKNSQRYVIEMHQGGIALPDRDYYFETGENFEITRTKYKAFLRDLFTMLGQNNPEDRAGDVYSIEEALAGFSMTAVQRRDVDARYNPFTIEQLKQEFTGFDWSRYFQQAKLADITDVIISQPKFVKGALELIESMPITAWQNYCIVRSIIPYMFTLPREYQELSFSFFGKVLSGATEQEPRYRRAIHAAITRLPEPTGKLYVEHHFDSTAKQTIKDLVGHIQTALRARIEKLDWMTDTTKQRAYQKLDTFMPLMGYPDQWRSYKGLSLGTTYFETIKAIDTFDWQYDVSRIMGPVDRAEWLMSPAMVNAYYWPNTNGITFPAAILQPPYFDATGDFAANYGAIGVVIGHEITHGFDDKGSKYDEVGNLESWWVDADRAAFDERARKLEAQYSNYTIDGRAVNGALTLGENIGDLGGVLIAYDALQAKLRETGEDKPVDGFTPEQRFFMSLARIWRTNIRPEASLRQLVSDPHSPAELRVNGVVTNIDAFYEAFQTAPENKLYQAPEDRVRIW